LTGAEIYFYELSRVLVKKGHTVTILSNIEGQGDLAARAERNGVRCVSFKNIGLLQKADFDIQHLSEPIPTKLCLEIFPSIPAVSSIHSSFSGETPVVSAKIKKYIYIRNDILPTLSSCGIPLEKTILIPNGIDTTRFNTIDSLQPEERMVLFAGTFDRIRKPTIFHLIKKSISERFKVVLMGTNHSFNESEMEEVRKHTIVLHTSWNIEECMKHCSETAGVMLGRTTIEGWFCGKPGWIYDIDSEGRIRDINLHPVPDDLYRYDIENVTTEIEKIYNDILG